MSVQWREDAAARDGAGPLRGGVNRFCAKQVRDLMFFHEAQEQFKDVGDEVKEGQVTVGPGPSSSSSSKKKKARNKKKNEVVITDEMIGWLKAGPVGCAALEIVVVGITGRVRFLYFLFFFFFFFFFFLSSLKLCCLGLISGFLKKNFFYSSTLFL